MASSNYRVTDKSILPSKRINLIANLRVGGSWAARQMRPPSSPASHDIDYIRVWKMRTPIVVVAAAWPPTCCQTVRDRHRALDPRRQDRRRRHARAGRDHRD